MRSLKERYDLPEVDSWLIALAVVIRALLVLFAVVTAVAVAIAAYAITEAAFDVIGQFVERLLD